MSSISSSLALPRTAKYDAKLQEQEKKNQAETLIPCAALVQKLGMP
jgi:hypothetical protein